MDIAVSSGDLETENRQLLSSFEFLPLLASVVASLTIGTGENKFI